MDTYSPIYGYVMQQLRTKRVPQRAVAVASGVPFSTLTKIAQGQIKAPSVHHIQALHDFFRGTSANTSVPEDHKKAA